MHLEESLATKTQELADLARLADGSAEALEELLQRGLEWLGRLAPYDLAVIFELTGEELIARAAHGAALQQQVRSHRIRLKDFPSIRTAIEERRSRVYTEADHAHGDGDLFDTILHFPHGHACMVVPLSMGSDVFGIMSLDRTECVTYPREVVDLVEVFARLLSLSIHCMRQNEQLARMGLALEERADAVTRHWGGPREGVFALSRSNNPRVRELIRQATLVAQTTSTVLLIGETGTGKERLTRFIHENSPRRNKPFVPVNCAALPSGTLESELFGHERGAFSGAVRARPGLIRAADGGTLFLDEVGELPLDVQGKLLRALQEGEVLPVGAERQVKVNVRFIAATRVDLEQAAAAGRFREDLYYRLSVYPLRLLPLRERMEDLEDICTTLLHELGPRVGKPKLTLSKEGFAALRQLDYPGNIRELSNLLERAAIRSASGVIGKKELGHVVPCAVALPAAPKEPEPLMTLAENEKSHIERTLEATGGKIYGPDGAAAILDLPPTTLQSRMKKLGIARGPGRA